MMKKALRAEENNNVASLRTTAAGSIFGPDSGAVIPEVLPVARQCLRGEQIAKPTELESPLRRSLLLVAGPPFH